MKRKLTANLILVVLFAAAIAAVPLWWLFTPDRTFSEAERRNLTQAPAFPLEALDDWDFDNEMETYLADQMPLREALVGINAYEQLWTGRQVALDVYRDRDGYLVEAPLRVEPQELERRLSRIAKLGETVGLPVRLLVPPSTGYVRRDSLPAVLAALYEDDVLLRRMDHFAGVERVPLDDFVTDGQTWFYRTDHHWNADGAYAAYCDYASYVGRTPLPRDAFYTHTVDGYVGSTRSRSALWLTAAERMTLFEPMCRVRVSFSDREGTFDSLLFWEHLSSYDWYPVYLDGNHPVTVIENLDAQGDDVLLLVKDSFANSLAPLLTPWYRKLVMVDPRYYRGSVSELCAAHGTTELLFCYSLERIATDTNLLLLK